MKVTHTQLEQIKKFAKEEIKKNDTSHGLSHTLRTIHLSKILAKKEKADQLKCTIITWLHDIGKNKEDKKIDHGNEGAKSAEKFLKKIKLEKQDIKDIIYAIKRHNKPDPHRTIESKIIWDADKLQAMGIEGLFRVYEYFIRRGWTHEEAYKKIISEQNFYFPKFRTKTGKLLAKKKFYSFKKINNKYKKELEI